MIKKRFLFLIFLEELHDLVEIAVGWLAGLFGTVASFSGEMATNKITSVFFIGCMSIPIYQSHSKFSLPAPASKWYLTMPRSMFVYPHGEKNVLAPTLLPS